MKTQKTRYARYMALAIALTGLYAMAPAASAQYPDQNRDGYRDGRGRWRRMRTQSYDRLRQWARELEQTADRARDQAQAQQAGYRGFRRDTKFLRSIDHFAERAQGFRVRIETYQTTPWDVDDEVQHLLRDARTVQTRLRRARFVDRRTVADWNRVVSLLNQMTTEYRAGSGYGTRYPTGDYRNDPNRTTVDPRYPNSVDPRNDPYPGEYRNDGGYGTYGTMTDLRQLAAELDRRADRASQLANGYSGFSSEIAHFSEQAREFRDQVESSRMSRSELRSEVNHLLEDAQSAYSELRQRNISRHVAAEWDAIVQVLNRMRALAV